MFEPLMGACVDGQLGAGADDAGFGLHEDWIARVRQFDLADGDGVRSGDDDLTHFMVSRGVDAGYFRWTHSFYEVRLPPVPALQASGFEGSQSSICESVARSHRSQFFSIAFFSNWERTSP